MMVFKLTLVAAFALLAVATPTPGEPSTSSSTNTSISQCNAGPIQCCNTVQPAGAPSVASLLSILGISTQDANIPIGITCDPVSVFGAGGNSCSANPVCCEDNSFNGVVALGCVPIDVSL